MELGRRQFLSSGIDDIFIFTMEPVKEIEERLKENFSEDNMSLFRYVPTTAYSKWDTQF